MTGPRRLLLVGLMAILVVLTLIHIGAIWPPEAGVDVDRPLRAADRWLAGETPYRVEDFTSGAGVTQPFLYPPYTLPFYAVLTGPPRGVVLATGVLLMLLVTIAACRRLGIPWIWMLPVVAWPPIAEGILTGNVQMLMFAALVFLFYRRDGSPWRPAPRDIAAPSESPAVVGGLAAFVGSIKVSQPHLWVFVLRHRRRVAILSAVVLVAVVAATLPLTGTDLWFEWLAQLQRAGDPTWDLGGLALPRFLPPVIGYAIAALCLVAVWFVPRRDPAPWLGVLSVVGSLSLQVFGLVFLIPAMLIIRREAAIVAAAFVATYTSIGAWAGIAVVLWCMLVITFGPETWRAKVAERPVMVNGSLGVSGASHRVRQRSSFAPGVGLGRAGALQPSRLRAPDSDDAPAPLPTRQHP